MTWTSFIDLHGHTLHSGLPLLAHPSLSHILRLSFCGWPQTTGASFIDHMVADKVVAVPEQASREFTEKLIMLPESYLPADHANLVGSVLIATASYIRGREPHFCVRLRFLIVLPEARLVRF